MDYSDGATGNKITELGIQGGVHFQWFVALRPDVPQNRFLSGIGHELKTWEIAPSALSGGLF